MSTGYEVELCVTCRGMGGAVGYHTSMLVNGREYYFSTSGIGSSEKLISHGRRARPDRIFFGFSQHSGPEMVEFLRKYFAVGTYDILRKNCNSFSDCALFFLTGQRLAWNFSAAERVGRVADSGIGLVQAISGGSYVPNPKAFDFDAELVISAVKARLGMLAESDDESNSESDAGEAGIDWECSTTGSDLEPERQRLEQPRPAQRAAPWRQVASCSSCASTPPRDVALEAQRTPVKASGGAVVGVFRPMRLVADRCRDPVWL